MSADPAALAALNVLLRQRRIFRGDHKAGARFAFLDQRRFSAQYRPIYLAAVAVLDRSGGRSAVEAVVLNGRMPRPGRQTDGLQDGLDALHTHFQSEGLL